MQSAPTRIVVRFESDTTDDLIEQMQYYIDAIRTEYVLESTLGPKVNYYATQEHAFQSTDDIRDAMRFSSEAAAKRFLGRHQLFQQYVAVPAK